MEVSGVDFQAFKAPLLCRVLSRFTHVSLSPLSDPLAVCEPPVSLKALAAVADASGQVTGLSDGEEMNHCVVSAAACRCRQQLVTQCFPAASAVVQRHLGQIDER
ncbi:unnamed protein product [Pleuronectes platessa]|uniref:Uncharacterized protein n=1 Tax=Pleuronectes platessa TaxID=8262 RepID=A0A9N7YRR2_PLEPL|nr:unnamed protein product [Pleuronectes platessa]